MYAKFDLSPIPSNAAILSAKLSLYTFTLVNSCCAPYGPMAQGTKYLYGVTGAWAENTINWENKAAISSTQITTCTNAKTPAWEEFTVTNTVKDMLSKPGTNHGFMVRCSEGPKDMGIAIRSSEAAQTEYRPKLTITYESAGILDPIHMNVKPAKRYKIAVYNMQGRLIASFVMKDIARLHQQIPAGVNIVKINDRSLKIVKQK